MEQNPIAMADNPAIDALTNNKEKKQIPVVTPDNNQPLDYVKTAALPDDQIDAGQPGKKNKLRGFFRKVTRTLEKRTNIKTTDDEDRLLLAGFAVKL